MAEIILPPPTGAQMASKADASVSTQEVSLDKSKTEESSTYALQWPNGMNTFLIVPNISVIEGELHNRGWETKVKQLDAIMMALFTMSLPEGQVTYPEKAAEDWAAAIGHVNGVINLGLLPDTPISVDSKVPENKDSAQHGITYGLQWPQGMNENLIIPNISVINNMLKKAGWQVAIRNLQAIMMALFTMSLPDGTISHPEKAAQDWLSAIGHVNGVINLGLLTGEISIDATSSSDSSDTSKDTGAKFAAQWPEGLNDNLLIPVLSVMENMFSGLGWRVTYRIYENLRIVIFTLRLPEGHHTYPEKALADFNKVMALFPGWKNLGSANGEISLDTVTIDESAE